MYRNFIDFPIPQVKTLQDVNTEKEEKKIVTPTPGFLKRHKTALIGAAVIAAAAAIFLPKGTIKKYFSFGKK